MPSDLSRELCADCGGTQGPDVNLLLIRRRYLCDSCFRKYVASKIWKRMESYSFRYQTSKTTRKLLLPLSGGLSGIVLLHVLDQQLQRQFEKQGRVAYELVLVHVHVPDQLWESRDDRIGPQSRQEWQKVIRSRFPKYEFLDIPRLNEVSNYDVTFERDLETLGISKIHQSLVATDEVTVREGGAAEAAKDKPSLVDSLFAAARTPTAKSELKEILLRRLLIATAKTHTCESIIWAHTDSRLAAKALADVATGRGGSIPNTTAEGLSPSGVGFNYPVRDLYKSELTLFLESQQERFRDCLLTSDQLKSESVGMVTSIRNTAISDLLTSYISSQGEKYPSIMANVVRTAAKLETPDISNKEKCKLCSMPVTTQTGADLCYGCHRLKQDIKI